jgi:carbon starvation protein CstA
MTPFGIDGKGRMDGLVLLAGLMAIFYFLFFIFSNQIAEKVMGIKQQRMAISKIKLK